MDWRTGGLVPTYTDGETFAWVIDGRIGLETPFGGPIVAWTEFVNQRSATDTPLLATFRANAYGPMFEIWRLSEPDAKGYRSASVLPRGMVTRYIPIASWPHRPDRQGTSPLLCKLWDEAQAQRHAEAEAVRKARAADPLIGFVDALSAAGTDYACAAEVNDEHGKAQAADRIRDLIAGLDQKDLAEVLLRVTIDYSIACLSDDSE